MGGPRRALLACMLGTLACAPSFASSVLLTQTFANSTAPGWTLLGNASLTGNGWLRLAPNAPSQSGAAFSTGPLPFTAGLDIRFNYAMWGGNGGDGLALALVDGAQTPAAAGGLGGSLGYAQNGGTGGLAGAILGVGLDVFGNFANSTEGRQNGPGVTPSAVTVRGPGDGSSKSKSKGVTNYDYLTTSGTLAAGANGDPLQLALNTAVRPVSAADYRQAEVIVDTTQIANGHLPVTVILRVGANGAPQTVVSKFDAYAKVLAFYGNDPTKIPKTFKLAFTGATGANTDNIEVQNLEVDSINDVVGFTSIPEPGTGVSISFGLVLWGLIRVRLQRRA